MKFKLYKIGTELEFNVGNFESYLYTIRNKLFPKVENPLTMPIVQGFVKCSEGLEVHLDKEYYSSQCEWKIKPVLFNQESINKIYDFTHNRVMGIQESSDNDISLDKILCHNKIPEFVGTHIHLFFYFDGKSGEKFFRGKTFLTKFLFEYFLTYFKQHKNVISKIIIKKELERMILNHNILQHFDYHVLGKQLRQNLNNNGIDYYHKNLDKIKYQPVFWSAPKPGKPMTLELRYIPNSFFTFSTPEDIYNFLGMIETIVNQVNGLSSEEFSKLHEQNKKDIVFAHNQMIEYYKSFYTSGAPNHLPRYEGGQSSRQQSQPGILDNRTVDELYYDYRLTSGNSHSNAYSNALRKRQQNLKTLFKQMLYEYQFTENDKDAFVSAINELHINFESSDVLWDTYLQLYNERNPQQPPVSGKIFDTLMDYFKHLLDEFASFKKQEDTSVSIVDSIMVGCAGDRYECSSIIIDNIQFDMEGNEDTGKKPVPNISLDPSSIIMNQQSFITYIHYRANQMSSGGEAQTTIDNPPF